MMEASLEDFVERFPSVKYWMDSLTCRDITKRSYLLHFRKFCQWLKKSPEDLIKERKAEIEDEDSRVQHNAEHQLNRYINYLRGQKYKPDTVRLAYYSVRSFYDNNYLTLDLKPGQAPKKGWPRGRATKEQVASLLKAANMRERTLILFIKDSGLAVGDVARLSYQDIQTDLERNEDFIAIKFERHKTGVPALTFVGPEAVQAMRDYLDARRRGTEYMYPPSARDRGVPAEIITPKSALFVQHDKTHRRLKAKDISRIIKRLAAKVGVPECTAHRLRKLFQTCLEDARVPFNWIQHFMAHKPLGVEGAYSLPSQAQLYQAYIEAYSYLQLEPSKLGMQKEIEELRKALKDREQEIQNLRENSIRKTEEILTNSHKKEREIAELRQEMEIFKKGLKTAQKFIEETHRYFELAGPPKREIMEKVLKERKE